MKMRAKLTVESVTPYGTPPTSETLKFEAKYDSANTPEDNSYSKYTPSASLTMNVTNPNLMGQFKPGQKFYVDFTEVPA